MNNRFLKNNENCNKERIIELLSIKSNSEKYLKNDLLMLKKELFDIKMDFNKELKDLIFLFDNKLELNTCNIIVNDKGRIIVENK